MLQQRMILVHFILMNMEILCTVKGLLDNILVVYVLFLKFYDIRFTRTFGFYEGSAAVVDLSGRSYRINNNNYKKIVIGIKILIIIDMSHILGQMVQVCIKMQIINMIGVEISNKEDV